MWRKKKKIAGRWFNFHRQRSPCIVATYKATTSSSREVVINRRDWNNVLQFFFHRHIAAHTPCRNTCCYSSRNILMRLLPLLRHTFARPIRPYVPIHIATDFIKRDQSSCTRIRSGDLVRRLYLRKCARNCCIKLCGKIGCRLSRRHANLVLYIWYFSRNAEVFLEITKLLPHRIIGWEKHANTSMKV